MGLRISSQKMSFNVKYLYNNWTYEFLTLNTWSCSRKSSFRPRNQIMYMNFLRHLYHYQNKLQAILTILCWLKKSQLLISWKKSEKICDVLFSGSGDLLNRNSYGIKLYITLKTRIWAFRICFLFYNSFIRTGDMYVWRWSSRFEDNCPCSVLVKVMWFWRKGQ